MAAGVEPVVAANTEPHELVLEGGHDSNIVEAHGLDDVDSVRKTAEKAAAVLIADLKHNTLQDQIEYLETAF